jgi:hypothetical protein
MATNDDGRQSPDDAAKGGSARYGDSAGPRGSGHQESKKPERKEARGFVSRQGGDQSRGDRGKRPDRGDAGDERGDR